MNEFNTMGQGALNQKTETQQSYQPNPLNRTSLKQQSQQQGMPQKPVQNNNSQPGPRVNPTATPGQQTAKNELKKWLWGAAGGSAVIGGGITGWIIFS